MTIVRTITIALLVAAMALSILMGATPYLIAIAMLVRAVLHL